MPKKLRWTIEYDPFEEGDCNGLTMFNEDFASTFKLGNWVDGTVAVCEDRTYTVKGDLLISGDDRFTIDRNMKLVQL